MVLSICYPCHYVRCKENFVFSAYALKEFKTGGKEGKREVLAKLGSNHEIIDKKLHFSIYKWLLPIYESVESYIAEMARLEPDKNPINTTQKEAYASLRLRWHAWRESFRNYDWPTALPVPDLVLKEVKYLCALV